MIIRLSHPWKWHLTRDILDTEDGDLTEPEARKLVRSGRARALESIVTDVGGGWYEVPLRSGKVKKVQGLAKVKKLLRREAGQ